MIDPLMTEAVATLTRGHALFAGNLTGNVSGADVGDAPAPLQAHTNEINRVTEIAGVTAGRSDSARPLRRSADTDAALARAMAAAGNEYAHASRATRVLLEAARADGASAVDTPIGRREAITRMVARLRAQHGHITRSHARARLLAQRLRRLHYPRHRQRRHHLHGGNGRAAVIAAIHKALDIKEIHDPAARARWQRGMDLVARRESNYGADAVNSWDSNAAKGTPSRGAWQFIAPTFAAYHEPGTSTDIDDLVSQACAFINYARGRYGVAADASNLADRIQQADPRRSPMRY
ncbi:MAG: transglycosylase [Mycobacterium sp.]|nr:transglycosylase [Mycobacterium sp.]